ncbi:MAG: flagellar motor stator protein MotA [Proteobacteria bacterium]|nr:flagellar motor stator protein MotA [Pseudomonadota bacterium]
MLFILGAVIVFACVFASYVAAGGHLGVLWQPFEFIIIGGAALGAFVIANPGEVLKKTGKGFKHLLKGQKIKKADYLELLTLMFVVFKTARTKGMLALESHIENPHESTIFNKFPKFSHNHEALDFFCDYLRLLTMGTNDVHQLEDLMNEELESHHNETHQVSGAIQTMADGFPALGIVAAVLGVIHTMGSITEPPEILGKMIGGALVGTFFGVFVSYGFVAPIASSLGNIYGEEGRYFHCMKAGIKAFVEGHPPSVAVEFARKGIFHVFRPSFYELEEAVNNVQIE